MIEKKEHKKDEKFWICKILDSIIRLELISQEADSGILQFILCNNMYITGKEFQ